MAKPKKQEHKVVDDGQILEEEASEVIKHEWKHFILGASALLLVAWFYSQYKETINQRNGEASGQYASVATEVSSLVNESLKNSNSKEFLEKEDRVIKNLDHLSELKQATYSTFGSMLKSAYLLYKDKAPSVKDISLLDEGVTKYNNVKEALILKELVSLVKCRSLIQSGDMDGAMLQLKSFLKESKVLFAEGSTLLLISSSDSQLKDNLTFVKEQLNLKPELEDNTMKALSELGYSL